MNSSAVNNKIPTEEPVQNKNKEKKKGLLRRMYNWVIDCADKPKAAWVLSIVSFAESSFSPIPPDVILIPMMVGNPKKAWFNAFICTLSSVLGGAVGYAIGYYLYASLGVWIIETYSLQAAFESFEHHFDKWGFWYIALKGLTPIPYKVVTIAAGLVKFNFWQFMVASVIARSFRFYMIACVLRFFGDKARIWIEKYLGLFLLASIAIIVIGFIAIKWI